jgi:hypothetical protein
MGKRKKKKKLDLYVHSAVFLFTQKAATHNITP